MSQRMAGAAARPTHASSESKQLLSFQLAEEQYAVSIDSVREIITYQSVTPLPQTSPAVLGVTNLRGRIILVVDLRTALGLDARAPDRKTCVVVTEVASNRGNTGNSMVGYVVDAVHEVIALLDEQIDPPPCVAGDPSPALVTGLARVSQDQSVLALLDLERLSSLVLQSPNDGIASEPTTA